MSAVLTWVHAHRKAILAGLGAALSTYLADRSGGVTADEWWEIVGAGLVVGGVVHQVPNKPAP